MGEHFFCPPRVLLLWVAVLAPLLHALPLREHRCSHDHLDRRPPAVVPQQYAAAAADVTRPAEVRSPGAVGPHAEPHPARGLDATLPGLRIVFSTETLDGDQHTCYAVGDIVAIGSPASSADVCDESMVHNCYFNCTSAEVLGAARAAQLRTRLLPAVSAWFASALRIKAPVVGRLALTARPCGMTNDVALPPNLVAYGSPDTDVLVFVTARPIRGTALAFAGHCTEDEGSERPYVPRRPVTGHINIDPSSLGTPESWDADSAHAQTVDATLKVLLHETMHVLVFTHDKIKEFPCPAAPEFNRQQRGSREPRDCAVANSPNPIERRRRIDNGVSHEVQHITTPKVVATARAHYNCPQTAAQLGRGPPFACTEADGSECLDGVPIEDDGGEGTAASHWEKRVLNGDLMVGTVMKAQVSAISGMTLSVFEDSGWYVANHAVVGPRCFYRRDWCETEPQSTELVPREPLLWGSARGCAFVTGKCNGEAWQERGYFCTTRANAGDGCTVGRRGVGFCTLQEYTSALPKPFQYLSDPRLGGKVMEDYCPIWQAYTNWDCRFSPADASSAAVAKASTEKGETRCEDCRCFHSSLLNSTTQSVVDSYYGCYEHRCLSPTQLQLRVDNGWHDCGLPGAPLKVPGWTGSVTCPDAAELCASAADLGWPTLLSVSPRRGPAAGGTTLLLRGRKLVQQNASGVQLPAVYICGVRATQVRLVGAIDETPQRLKLVTPPSAVAHNVSCSVRVAKDLPPRYDEAPGAYLYYVPPSAAQPACDISGGWDADKAICVLMRVWPYAMTGFVGFNVAMLLYDVSCRKLMVHRIVAARLRASAREHRVTREAL